MALAEIKQQLRSFQFTPRLNLISNPTDLFENLSVSARAFIRTATEIYDAGEYSPADFLSDEWEPYVCDHFWSLSEPERLEVVAFTTAILHELVHLADYVTTPYGANLHGKLRREYQYFQRYHEVLAESSEAMEGPLVDWLADPEVGAVSARALSRLGPLGQARARLRGPTLFHEFALGAPPRRLVDGWGSRADSIRLGGGRAYDKVTVTGVFASIRLGPHAALGPWEIVEGRALAMCLRYLLDLLDSRPDETASLLSAYIDEFYGRSSRYLTAMTIVTGRDWQSLVMEGTATLRNAIELTLQATWYALQSPQPKAEDDLLISPTARFVQCARAMAVNGLQTYVDTEYFLRAIDERVAHVIGTDHDLSSILDLALEGLEPGDTEEAIANPELAMWFDSEIGNIRRALRRRRQFGYVTPSGLPDRGVIVGGLLHDLEGDFHRPPSQVGDWYATRKAVVRDLMLPTRRAHLLRDWFELGL